MMARTVLVTGGGRGIGLGVVLQFLDEGCNVTVLEKNLDAADPSFADLVASTPQLWAMVGDLNNPDDREAFLAGHHRTVRAPRHPGQQRRRAACAPRPA